VAPIDAKPGGGSTATTTPVSPQGCLMIHDSCWSHVTCHLAPAVTMTARNHYQLYHLIIVPASLSCYCLPVKKHQCCLPSRRLTSSSCPSRLRCCCLLRWHPLPTQAIQQQHGHGSRPGLKRSYTTNPITRPPAALLRLAWAATEAMADTVVDITRPPAALLGTVPSLARPVAMAIGLNRDDSLAV